MALIPCPECWDEISEFAESCPHCGYIIAPGEADEIKASEELKREKEAKDIGQGHRIIFGCGFVFLIIFMLMNYVRCY